MASSGWDRLINKLVPMALLPRRRNVETLVRGLYGRHRGHSLDQDFQQFGLSHGEADLLFDMIDERFGAQLMASKLRTSGNVMNEIFLFMAAFLQHKRSQSSK